MLIKSTVQTELTDMYQLTLDAYTGGGGFANGEYLKKFGRELNFPGRQEMASYSNFLKPAINAQVDPPFSQMAKRVYKQTPLIAAFLLDVDNNGTKIQEFVKREIIPTITLGNNFAIMDNFKADEMPETQDDVLATRKFPYVYSKGIMDVYQYCQDKFGNLLSITFYYGKDAPSKEAEELYIYKEYTPYSIRYYKAKRDGTGVCDETELKHTLGEVPVVFYNKSEITPLPPYYQISKQSQSIYNIESEANDLHRSQNFSILLIPSTNANEEQDDSVIVGTNNALFYDSENGVSPSYISPDSKIMDSSISYYDKVTNTLIQSMDILGSSAVQRGSKSESGVALAYKFFGKQQAIKNTARMAEYIEEGIIRLFGLFTNDDYEYSVKYEDKFIPNQDEIAVRIDTLTKAIDMGISPVVTRQARIDAVNLLATQGNWNQETLTSAINSIKEEPVIGAVEPEEKIDSSI